MASGSGAFLMARGRAGFVGGALLLGWVLSAPAHATGKVFIPDAGSGNLHVIDATSDTTLATIALGGQPFGVAVDSVAARVYVVGSLPPSIKVIDADSHALLQSIPLPYNGTAAALTPKGERLYVSHSNSNKVTIYDTTTMSLVASVDALGAFGLAAHPDGQRMYVALGGFPGAVVALDTATHAVIATVPAAAFPRGIAVHPAGDRVYVASIGGQLPAGLTVIDTTDHTPITTVPLGLFPYGVAVSPSGTEVYVTNNGSSQLSVVDARDYTVLRNVDLAPGYPTMVGVHPVSGKVHVTQSQPPALKVFDARCLDPLATIPMDEIPAGLGSFYYTPQAPSTPAAVATGPEVEITGIELTQAVQDLENTVPLLNLRRTYARVHVRSNAAAVPGVTATLSALGYFFSGGSWVEVPLGHILPSNAAGARITVRPEPRRSVLDESFLFELPWKWTGYRSLRLHVSLSAPNGPPLVSCGHEVQTAPLFEFEQPVSMAVRFARLRYRLADGTAVTASIDEMERSASFLARSFPLSRLITRTDPPLEDPELAAHVDQTHPFCARLLTDKEDRRSLCAFYRASRELWRLVQTTSYGDGYDLVYGLIPQDPSMPFTRGACCLGKVSAGPADDDDYASHEIGHFLGRAHPSQASGRPGCGHSNSDPDYPYFFTHIAPLLDDPRTTFAGFDVGDPALGQPLRALPHTSTFDVMGYCSPTTWISDYTYRGLRNALFEWRASEQGRSDATASGPLPGDLLLVSGLIETAAGSGALSVLRVDRATDLAPPPAGAYSIRWHDGDGLQLASQAIAVESLDDTSSDTSASQLLGFQWVLPFVPGTRELRLVHTASGETLDSVQFSAHAPEINSDPQATFDAQGGRVLLAWTASDADSDPLQFDVHLLREQDGRVLPLVTGLSAQSLELPDDQLPGGGFRLRVVASDGVQTVSRDSNPIQLPPRGPTVRIRMPTESSRFRTGQTVNLSGEAWDPQDDLLDHAALTWTRAGNTLGQGEKLDLTDLPVGTHVLYLEAVNSLGLTGIASVTIVVDDDPAGPVPMLVVGPTQIAWQLAEPTGNFQDATLDIGNPGSTELDFQVGELPDWLNVDQSSGTTPASLQIYADPTNVAAGEVRRAVLHLHVVGQPGQTVVVPVSLAVGDTFTPGNGTPPPPLPDAVHADGFEAP